MRILTLENQCFEMNELPDEIDELRFSILDNSNPEDADFFFIPLIFLESFTAPSAVLSVGKHTIQMPLDWQVLIGDPEIGDLEIVPISSISERGFKAFCSNPVSTFRPEFLEINITDIYSDVKWYFPKIKTGQLLSVPLTNGPSPLCAYFAKEISRAQSIVNVGDVW